MSFGGTANTPFSGAPDTTLLPWTWRWERRGVGGAEGRADTAWIFVHVRDTNPAWRSVGARPRRGEWMFTTPSEFCPPGVGLEGERVVTQSGELSGQCVLAGQHALQVSLRHLSETPGAGLVSMRHRLRRPTLRPLPQTEPQASSRSRVRSIIRAPISRRFMND